MTPLTGFIRISPLLILLVLVLPVLAGLAGVLLPAFGWLPALGGEQFSLEAWRQLLAQPGLWRMVRISLLSGLLTPLLSLLLVALFIGAWSDTASFRRVRRLLSPLLSVPHAAAALALAFLVAPSGLLARWFSPWLTGWEQPPDLLIVNDPLALTMMAGLVIKEVPFLLLVTLAALPQCRADDRVRMARSLGYAPLTGWCKAVFPSLYPLIRLPVFAVIAFASSTVDVAMILGPTNPPPLSVAVIRWLNDPELETRFMASAGAVLQLLVTLTAVSIWWAGERLVARLARSRLVDGRRGASASLPAALSRVLMLLVVAVTGLGMAGLLIWSVAGFWRFPEALPAAWTMTTWTRAVALLQEPLGMAAGIGAASAILSLLLVLGWLEYDARYPGARLRVSSRLVYLPLVVPAVAFLFGLVLLQALSGSQPGWPPVLAGHLVFVLPYVYLSLSEAYRRQDPRWVQLARTLGAGPDRAFLAVRLPLLLTPCLTALAVGFAVSIGQYLPTLLLGAGRVTTVTTEAVALASGGDRRLVAAVAVTQAVLPLLAFLVALVVPAVSGRYRKGLQ